ncbi:hypothetical protein [Nonomuraea sp. NPDC050786]|uniref:hypothetical protein n=1 Tax=Nonomuraea sp. NPDC050786 TaxID=3154840 RepID=UPI0033D1267C
MSAAPTEDRNTLADTGVRVPASSGGAGQSVPGALPRSADPHGIVEIAGLRPRQRPGDGGQVSQADVDLIDALDPLAWRTVADWLQERPSVAGRGARVQILAAFLRWLHTVEPGLNLLAATGEHVDTYCRQARSGALTVGVRIPGKPLSSATVTARGRVLSSFYRFAWSAGVLSQAATPPDITWPRAMTRDERRRLRHGASCLAADGRLTEAAAVALLEATGAGVDALASLTGRDLHAVGESLVLITVRNSQRDVVTFPIPESVMPWLRVRSSLRSPEDLLIARHDGRPTDSEWLRRALVDAALAGGIPERRAKALCPPMLRAVTATSLVEQAACDVPASSGA